QSITLLPYTTLFRSRHGRYRLRIRRRPALRSQPPGRPRPARDDGRRRAPSLRDAALAGAAWRGRSTLRGWSGQSPGAGMRLAGKIIEWHDERGFGFIAQNGGSQRVFAPVRDFEGRARRPVVGDPVTYAPGQAARGRPMATRVRNVRQPAQKRRSCVSRFPRTAVALVALAGVGAGVFAGLLPLVVGFAYLFMTGVSYFMYWADKSAAQNEARRTPEANLHLVDLLCGWPGALLAQQQFRHKTVKQPFQAVFWLTVVTNIAGVAWLVYSGMLEGIG